MPGFKIALRTYFLNRLLILVASVLLVKATKAQDTDTCFAVSLATVTFTKTKVKLTSSIKKKLDSVILIIINTNQRCALQVTGTSNVSCRPKGRDGQRSWDRVNNIVSYLINNGISEDRIIFAFTDIKEDVVELQLHNNDILKPPLQPHPNLRRNKR